MPAILEWTHTVVEDDLDGLGHANNISYLKWMQSAALAHSAAPVHSAAQGWSVEAYAALGCGRVVRSHFIEYLAPALLGEQDRHRAAVYVTETRGYRRAVQLA